jgi:hypothetical protein
MIRQVICWEDLRLEPGIRPGNHSSCRNNTSEPVYETRTTRIWLEEDWIIRFVFSPGGEITLIEVEKGAATMLDLSRGLKCPSSWMSDGLKRLTEKPVSIRIYGMVRGICRTAHGQAA